MTSDELLKAEERYRRDIREPLDRLLEMSNRRAALPNILAWVAVVGLGFAVCILILMVIGGG